MTIKDIAFTGEMPPNMWPNPITADKQMNEWRNRNPDLRIISIETRQRIPVRPEPGDKFIQPMFDLLLVWYEENHTEADKKSVIQQLREYADIAESGDKPHWAKAMREAVALLQQPPGAAAQLAR